MKALINHKFSERRLLVAEACGVLSPYLPSEIRSSLVLSMLQQMLQDDRSEFVKEAATRSFGLLVGFIDNPDKYTQLEQLLMQALFSSSSLVAKAAQEIFLPSVAVWSMHLRKLESHLFTRLLKEIETIMKDYDHIKGSVDIDGKEECKKAMDVIEKKLLVVIEWLKSLIPVLYVSVLQTVPFPNERDVSVQETQDCHLPPAVSPLLDIKVLFGDNSQLHYSIKQFNSFLEQNKPESCMWTSLQWVVQECLPRLCRILGLIEISQVECIQSFSSLFLSFCTVFGHGFALEKIYPLFHYSLKPALSSSDPSKMTVLERASLPVFVSVLAYFHKKEDMDSMSEHLKESIITISKYSLSLDGVKVAFLQLIDDSSYHELLLNLLWDLLVHREPSVRMSTGSLLQILIKDLNMVLISKRVIPALVTLSSDGDIDVRVSVIAAFGSVVEHVVDKEVLEKVYVQFQTFLEDPYCKNNQEITIAMIQTFARIGPYSDPRFRDEYLLPKLCSISEDVSQHENEEQRRLFSVELFEAFVALTCCFLSKDLLQSHIIPALRCLQRELNILACEYQESVSMLIKECEAKLEEKCEQSSSTSLPAEFSAQKIKFFSKLNRFKDASPQRVVDIFKKKERSESIKSMP